MSNEQSFEGWAIVEVKGFTTYAGLVTEVRIAGEGFLRVDVPGASASRPAYTKYIHPLCRNARCPTPLCSVGCCSIPPNACGRCYDQERYRLRKEAKTR